MFSPAAVKRVVVPAAILNERVSPGARTPPGGAVIGQLKHMTPENGRNIKKVESLLSSVDHANTRQFYELSA